jgi:hypothetical protein
MRASVVLALLLAVVVAPARDTKPASIQVAPGDFVLDGAWASQRIVVTGRMPDGSLRDVTAQAQFKSSNPKIAAVTKIGFVSPRSDGEASITVTVSNRKQKLHVTVKDSRRKLASFRHSVEPVFETLGCNSAACHGSQRGKGGLKLSLFGGDPEADFDTLTRAAGGRRINRAEPRDSLLFLKATGGLPHPGKTAKPGTAEYEKLLAWLEAGAPAGAPADPQIVSLTLYPDVRLLPKGDSQRLLAMASFSDGAQRDVTAETTFHSSAVQTATVEGTAVQAADFGDAAIVATYLRKSAVLRIAVPQPGPKRFPALASNNRIDDLVYAKLKTMGIPPSELATDAEFLRRIYLDVTGLLPTPEQAQVFLADSRPKKRAALVDRLLESDQFTDFWALKWGDLLRIKSEFPVRLWPKAVAVYYQWVHQSIAENKPYDRFARELLTATGSNFRVGPANFVRAVPSKDARTTGETAALVFMGARVGCARCHAHPLESWTLDEDLGLGAFFARVNYKATGEWKEEIVYPDAKGVLRNPRTRQAVEPRVPGGAAVKVAAEEDPRGQFAAWLTAPGNPWFARNVVNRVWYWLLGTGLVNEPDDLRPTNPPTNPELLAFLEQELTSRQFDLRHIYRLILNSRTYQLSSEPNQWNALDTTHFSHYQVKRLTAEQMLDAVSQVTETNEKFRSIIPEPFSNWPADYKATQLADGNMECSFLDLFGRPGRDTPYESERDSDLTLRQTLYFLNSEQLEGKVSGSPRLKRLLAKSDGDLLDELYLTAVSRPPTEDEKRRLQEYLTTKKSTRAQAVQDIAWAVLNAKEFQFNH